MGGQQIDVIETLAQGRQPHLKDIEPVVEIFAQLTATHRVHRLAIGRGNDPHVGLEGLVRADPHERSSLEHPQQLDLKIERHLGDLIEEQRAAVRPLEKAAMLPDRPGKAALLVTEEFALNQLRRDRTAIDRQKGMGATPRQFMNRLRDHFLAGPALAHQQHADRGWRNARDLVVEPLHRG